MARKIKDAGFVPPKDPRPYNYTTGPDSPFSNEEKKAINKANVPKKVKRDENKTRKYRVNINSTPNSKSNKAALKLYKTTNQTAPTPRTGPSSGGGGQSARYNRLTGGLRQHGR